MAAFFNIRKNIGSDSDSRGWVPLGIVALDTSNWLFFTTYHFNDYESDIYKIKI